ncbi:MAG: AAA family ATPase [Pseudomonadota bacterium]
MTSAQALPTLFVIVGPNGAGKTTSYKAVLKNRVAAPSINAKLIQRDVLNDPSMDASYTASQIASERRQALIRDRRSFVTETVFSHSSKLDLIIKARDAGFGIVVFHLDIVSSDLAVTQVEARVEEGGHPVPAQKIRQRYARNKALIKQTVLMADATVIFDATRLNEAPRRLAKFVYGRPEFVGEDLPDWFSNLYGDVTC